MQIDQLELIKIDHSLAEKVDVSGGKGANTYILRQLSFVSRESNLHVPETSIITSFAYENVVLSNSDIKEKIKSLDKHSQELKEAKDDAKKSELDDLVKNASTEIRRQIEELELPPRLRNAINQEFVKLGGTIAVRSSANVEDLKEHAAAGQALTCLNVGAEQAICCVKKVWASLFADGFVTTRNLNPQSLSHSDVRMAVLLQELIVNVKAAGVITSVHPSGRPAYNINAQPGYGEGVVQGEGEVDSWVVGLRADAILERQITEKKSKVKRREGGGTETIKIEDFSPCLSDEEVLKLVGVVRDIHHYYRKHELAENIDVEFVVDNQGDVYIVQARSEELKHIQKDKGTIRLTVVDEENVPSSIQVIQLDSDSLTAQPGAVTAYLQVMKDPFPSRAKVGVIIVTLHTNNSWNDKFAHFKGIITIDGGNVCHAAKNSRDHGIPCLVGTRDAIKRLEAFDGKTVTLDAESRKVYIGKVAIKEEQRDLSMWITDPERLEEIHRRGWRDHEIYRTWDENHDKRKNVFVKNCEGLWRRRSHINYPFQVDYYYRAWDALTDYLNKKFAHRNIQEWELASQERELQCRRDDTRPKFGLVHMITDGNPIPDDPKSHRNIFYFLAGLDSIDIGNFRELYEERWMAFQTFGTFVENTDNISAYNVRQLVNGLIELFTWMHFAFWLNACVEILYAFDQLKYIDSKFHDVFMTVAIQDEPEYKRTDLSRQKDKVIYVLIEKVQSDSRLLKIFTAQEVEKIKRGLEKDFPEIYEEIMSWSTMYKATREHLHIPSDTEEYIKLIRDRINEESFLGIKLLAFWYRAYVARPGRNNLCDKEILDDMKSNDEDLYWLLQGFARRVVTKGSLPAESDMITAIGKIKGCGEEQQKIEKEVERILGQFPRLKRILKLSKLETILREDGHHYIVKYQRKIAKMMRELAENEKYEHIFDCPDDIFSIGTSELIALLWDKKPDYIKLTFKRWQVMAEAEKILPKTWSSNREQVLQRFEDEINKAINILDEQYKLANNYEARRYYQEEKERLQQRVKRLKSRALSKQIAA